jgi:hypothetical protein
MRGQILATATLALLPHSPVFAQDCPTAADGKRGFVVERGERQVSQVFHTGDGIVRTVMRYGGTTMLETTLFEGLFSLERIDRGRRMVRTPKTNLAPLFPLQPGRKVVAVFELSDYSGKKSPSTVVLAVKGTEQIFIGPCRFSVLKIEESESRGEYAPRLISTDYYSPDLKLVLAREYDRGARREIVKFDRIYTIK